MKQNLQRAKALQMDIKVRVTGQDGKEMAVRPYLHPWIDLNGNVFGFYADLKDCRLPEMNSLQFTFYRKKRTELDRVLCAFFSGKDEYLTIDISRLPNLAELQEMLRILVGRVGRGRQVGSSFAREWLRRTSGKAGKR